MACYEPEMNRPFFGFTLLELVIAMAIGLIVLAAMYGLFTTQQKQLGTQEQIIEMQQNARMAMDMMSREIRMAGYDPSGALTKCTGAKPGTLSGSTCMGIFYAGASVIQFNMNTLGETITYGLYTPSGDSVQCLGRKTAADSDYQTVVEDIQSLQFRYLISDTSTESEATDLGTIRSIKITLVARTSKRDPSWAENDGYRTYRLESKVTPRNLAY
jgi:type IV pilus assembly protein PilW